MGPGLSHDRWERELRLQTVGLADLVRGADAGLAVPTCPGWTISVLARHVGRAHRWATTVVTRRASARVSSREAPDRDPPDDPAARARWLEDGAVRLAEAVRTAGPGTRVWTWAGDQTAGFWLRRMVHETTVHRADATLAVGRPVEIASEIAADGISEWLEILPYLRGDDPDTSGLLAAGQSIHLHAVDPGLGSGGEWVLRGTADGLDWEHGHQKADVAVRGAAADLLLLLLRRIPCEDPRVEIIGDRAVLDGWLARTPF